MQYNFITEKVELCFVTTSLTHLGDKRNNVNNGN